VVEWPRAVIPVGLIESRLTYEHLRQLPDDGRRHELVEGELVVSPAPTTKHQRVVRNIGLVLLQAQASGAGEVLWAPTDVVLDPQVDAVEPDLLFVVSERRSIIAEDQVRGAPDLLVEVLSDSTAERDLGVKLRIYARYGVRFYWSPIRARKPCASSHCSRADIWSGRPSTAQPSWSARCSPG
jgi:Uma2 family endonuclease